MKKTLAYLYLIGLAVMLIWLFAQQPLMFLAMVLWIGLSLGLFLGIGWLVIYSIDRWRDYRYGRRLRRLLGDRTIESVLEQSPYDYGYVFQGDDGYRIWRKDSPLDFIQSGVSAKSARLWIVEQFVQESGNGNDLTRE